MLIESIATLFVLIILIILGIVSSEVKILIGSQMSI